MALFRCSSDALGWAFNYTKDSLPVTAMSRAALDAQKPTQTASARTGPRLPRGVDAAAQAGMIFLEFAKLSVVQRAALQARVMPQRVPCTCSHPCCSGWRPEPEWEACLELLGSTMKDEAMRTGKRTLSSLPLLRKQILLAYFNPGFNLHVARLAERLDISEATVYNHRHVITTYLQTVEGQGWTALDALLVARALVGDTTSTIED